MKIKSGFMLRTISGNPVVVPVGERAETFRGMITMNNTAMFLWKQLEQGATEDELVRAILEAYGEVDEARARSSVKDFVAKLQENDILE